MKQIATIAELRVALDATRAAGATVGFVPTMGYLHDGHASLMRSARAAVDSNDSGSDAGTGAGGIVVTSIFVNPLQFAAGEDLEDYPRDLERDLALAEAAGADIVFTPSVEEMYPRPVATTVTVAGVSEGFESGTRPTHFAGVATVVAKLFAIVGPCVAFFGEKDFQQLAVVRRMAADLSLPVEVVGCETVREPDGLALSSRNVYLSADERRAATVLHRALGTGRAVILAGETDDAAVVDAMTRVVDGEPLARLDYCAVVDAADLTHHADLSTTPSGDLRLLIAVHFGTTRLIDNQGVTGPPAPTTRS